MNFVQISDLHIGHPPHKHGIDPCISLDSVIDDINSLASAPDFILATGDLVAEETAENYALLNKHLDRLNAPYFVMPGNHDDRDMIRAQWPTHDYLQSVSDHLCFSLEMDAFDLIALDTQKTGEEDGFLCAERLDWLEEQLAASTDKPIIIAQHHPTNAWLPVEPELKNRYKSILSHTPNIQAILSGHLHRTITTYFAGLPVLTAPSTAYPFFKAPESDIRYRVTEELSGYVIHYWTSNGLESHTVHVTNP